MVLTFLFLTLIFLLFLLFKVKDFKNELLKKSYIVISFQSLVLSISLGFYFWNWQSTLAQKYPYPISGTVPFEFQNKNSDLIAIFFCIIIFVLSFLLLTKLYKDFEEGLDLAYISILPFAIMVGQWLKVEKTKNLLFISFIFVLFDIIIRLILKKLIFKNYIKLEDFHKIYIKIALTSLFFIFSSFGIYIFLNRIGFFIEQKYIFILLSFLFFISIYFKKKLDFLLTLSQVGIPFLISIFVPPPIFLSNGTKENFHYKDLNYFILFILTVFALLSITKKFFKKSDNESTLKLISPWSLILILIFLSSSPYSWPFVLPDDFHNGNIFLPFYLLKEYKYFPFLDFQPAYGFYNYLPGFFSYIFYDGTFSGITMIRNHLLSIFVVILFFALKKELGLFISFFLSFCSFILINGPTGQAFTLALGIFILLLNFNINKNLIFILWFLFSSFLWLFNIPDGTPCVLGMLPFGIYTFLKSAKENKKEFLKYLIIFSVIIFIIILITKLDKAIVSQIKYLIENASINSVAQGIKWEMPTGKERVTFGPFWQFIRFLWLFIFIPITFIILFKKKELFSNKKLLFLTLFIIISLIFLIPRSAGRIDKMELSRPYPPNFFVFFALPIILLPFLKNKIYFFLFLSPFLGALGIQENSFENCHNLLKQTRIYKPENLIYGKKEEICGIGEGVIMDKNQLERQKNIKKTLKNLLKKNETFYDTTNHISDYFFQGLPCPTRNSTIYDISSKKLQLECIKELKEKEVPLVLIYSENFIFDGGTLPFRAPEVYFYLQENFFPFEGDRGYIWMIKKENVERIKGKYEIKDIKGQIELLSKAFFMKNLKGLPSSWGASIQTISKMLKKEINLNVVHKNDLEEKYGFWEVMGEDPYIVFKIPEEVKGEYIFLKLKDEKKINKNIQVFWANELFEAFDENNSLIFSTSKFGKYLVPLSYIPSYQKISKKRYIRLDFQGFCGDLFKIEEISAYKRLN